MNKYRDLLKHCLGDDGFERLEKAIVRRGTQNVADPLELYLPLMVVPRTILSWLVQNIQPMRTGENRDLRFPGRDDIVIHIIKDNTDVYRGEFIQGGKLIHEFSNQTLPSIGGHMMTVGEQYSHLSEPSVSHLASPNASTELPEPVKSDDEGLIRELERDPSLDMPKKIMELAIPQESEGEKISEEGAKWMWAHSNVKELTGVIGKLIDALVSKKLESDHVGKKLDEIDKEELVEPKKDPNIISEKISDKTLFEIQGKDADKQPKPKSKEVSQGQEARAAKPEKDKPLKKEAMPEVKPKDDPSVISEKISDKTLFEIQGKDADKQPKPKPTDVPQGKDARNATVEKEKGLQKDALSPSGKPKHSANRYFRQSYRQRHDKLNSMLSGTQPKPAPTRQQAKDLASKAIEHAFAQQGKEKKVELNGKPATPVADKEILEKPYVSDAQRRWAHTSAGTKALGGKSHVHEWDEATKGKKLPEHVNKGQLNAGAKLFSPPVNILQDKELGKAGMPEKPAGAGMPKGPSIPQAPKPPVGMTNNPAGAAAKQAQASSRGMSASPKMPMPKVTSGLPKPPTMKSERKYAVSNEEIYAPCEYCGLPEFKKSEGGPVYSPCHCFRITLKNEEGQPQSFVKLSKTTTGYNLSFAEGADPDSVKAFLLTLKAQLLTQKKLGRYGV